MGRESQRRLERKGKSMADAGSSRLKRKRVTVKGNTFSSPMNLLEPTVGGARINLTPMDRKSGINYITNICEFRMRTGQVSSVIFNQGGSVGRDSYVSLEG